VLGGSNPIGLRVRYVTEQNGKNPWYQVVGVVRDFGIDMHEPKDVTVRGTSARVHLDRSIALAYDNLIAKAGREISRVIGASAVGDNNLRFWRSVTQMLKKWAYE
jgi:hypothetical protein